MSANVKTAAKPGRARRKRDSLSRDIIVAAAETVAMRDGLDGLTFQAIGVELDAHPTSVYRHFRDKDELLLELIDTLRARSYGGMHVPSESWQDDLRAAARAVHAHYLRYSMFAQQMAARTTRRPTEFANVEFSMQAILRAGFDTEEAMLVHRAFGNFVRGISSLEGAMHALPEGTRHTDELAWQVEYRQLDSEEYPSIAAIGQTLPGIGDPNVFEVALDLQLAGIEALAARAVARREAGPA
ncbi:TetR/AcrR family transcriptional regulator C-terminal domain-containing protein [Rathayibacter sp. VKM Ac-2760]|uniref:TetR/AcrR family transcriptional regulator n=1 Tax=Rathayibacter sp. VKM Ac-2760 TaxID=2609253 RepID=UPI001316F639|nr:TetR/AcrR family transcriptional regulator C-terminal domain-containing protein [Rathayibacter sp. VKM Ac-2760]QHC61197.1 TetR family transcriptional regulator [Rathayibacter sp. VKM Ac-2760]